MPGIRGNEPACRICGGETCELGRRYSSFSRQEFTISRCVECQFAFVADPRTDFDALYDEKYYAGRGADPAVDYLEELQNPSRTIRRYEWRGILEIVSSLIDVSPATSWLDYGCGTGGLVLYANAQGIPGAVGFEEGLHSNAVDDRGITILTAHDIESAAGQFDVITAIEVIEHVIDPVCELTRLRRLLKPGGLLFLTTGNSLPFQDRLLDWSYVVPDVHVSYFEPSNLALAMKRAGFEPTFPGYRAGWEDVIRFKVLKSIRPRCIRRLNPIVPWSVAARIIDHRLGVSAHPVGWARNGS
jgi:SAM-dependent methyltransferase